MYRYTPVADRKATPARIRKIPVNLRGLFEVKFSEEGEGSGEGVGEV